MLLLYYKRNIYNFVKFEINKLKDNKNVNNIILLFSK